MEVPDRIYIQTRWDADDNWRAHRLFDGDIEYIRAAHVAALEAENKRYLDRIKELTEQCNEIYSTCSAFRERNAELELRLDAYHGNMMDVLEAENARLREVCAELVYSTTEDGYIRARDKALEIIAPKLPEAPKGGE